MRSLSSAPAKIRNVQEGLPTRGQSPRELKAQLELEREGSPYLIHRDAEGVQHLTTVPGGDRLRIGRAEGADLVLGFDTEVSRLHAEIERAGGEYIVIDDGLSSNGTYVNGSRVAGRRRLRDRDVVQVGETLLVFRNPADEAGAETIPSGQLPARHELTKAQLGVLEALCRPVRLDSIASPATNTEIAEQLHLSVGAVKAHLRALFEKFSVEDLPQTRKRIRLAELALISGAVSPWDRDRD
jgi:pSer/pThr/pTyr-binding forkhead associated (FHA) protein